MILKQVMAYTEHLADEFHPERVILFGSIAEGRATADSDVGLMVVLAGIPRRETI